MYGMKLSMLTEELLKEILLLYDKILEGDVKLYCFSSGSPSMAQRLEWLKEGLSGSNAVDWRYGSKLKTKSNMPDKDAKLIIWREKTIWKENEKKDTVIRFSFDPNIISGEEADRLKKQFEYAIDKLLLIRGVGINLSVKEMKMSDVDNEINEIEKEFEDIGREIKEMLDISKTCNMTQKDKTERIELWTRYNKLGNRLRNLAIRSKD
jgi:hypothetical protein